MPQNSRNRNQNRSNSRRRPRTMSKIRRQVRQQTAQVVAGVEELLTNSNEAYTKGVFHYLRVLVHALGAAQFIYGIYYHWFNVHWPKHINEEEDLKAHWGGKFRFLTFLDVIIQAIYHSIALVNDLVGSNEVGQPRELPTLRKIKDYMFAAWAFPISLNVCISFWTIYAYDRELIFPSALDEIFPTWLNHIVHTNVAMLCILDLFTCFRQYPPRVNALSGTVIFMLLYIIWVHIVRYFSGQWVYPLLEVLDTPMRYVMLSALLGFTVLCYYLGEYLNEVVWAPELRLLKQKARTE